MEKQLRALFYDQFAERQVAFNPTEPEPFDLVDLTRDMTNSTRIYHLRTECVREAMAGANLIMTDTQALAQVVRQALPRARVAALPFGPLRILARLNPPASPPVVGLLNHSGDVEMNNLYALKLLKSLDQPLLIYGRPLPGLEAEVMPDFIQFSHMCDILLLPSLPGAINSITLPLTAMAAGNVAILAHNAPGYYELDPASGVQILPNEPDAWRLVLNGLVSQPAKLRAMQDRNKAFAQRVNRASWQRLTALLAEPAVPASPISAGCGCAKKSKSAPTQPISITFGCTLKTT